MLWDTLYSEITGKYPIKSAKVVSPNEKPLKFGIIFARAVIVIGIVKLKKNIPKIANCGIKPYFRSGIESNKPIIATLYIPNLSAKKPPDALPKAIAKTKVHNIGIEFFATKSYPKPTKDRIQIEIRIKSTMAIYTGIFASFL